MDKLRERIQKHMEYLCLECGPRQCGSKGEKMAADYIESEFKALGYETVREEYPTVGWNCTEFYLRNVTKNYEIPCVTAAYFSNSVDVEDTLVWITENDIKNLDKMDLKGKFCLVSSIDFGKKYNICGLNGLSEVLESYGVKAAIFISATAHTDYKPSTKYPRSPHLKNMGVATVSQMGAYEIARNRDDVYRLVIKAEKFDTISYNVIARQKGGEKKGVIGAHYDTAPFVQGAEDDASGTTLVIELARLFKDKYKDWSFDFCAFSAEEYIPNSYAPGENNPDIFPPGSYDYVRRHKDENLKWFLNIDGAAGIFYKKFLQVSLGEKLPKLKADCEIVHDNKTLTGDDKAFVRHGIPKLWLRSRSLFAELHTELDCLDTISYDTMVQYAKDYADLLEQLTQTR